MSLNLNGDHMIDDFIFNEEFKGEIPESMAAVIGVLGKEDAYKFYSFFSDAQCVYVSEKSKKITEAVGLEACKRLAHCFYGEVIYIPRAATILST